MFERLLNNLANMSGIEERDIEMMLRSSSYLTQDQLLIVTRFFQRNRAVNIFFSKKIGFLKVSIKFLKDNVVEYYLNDMSGTNFCTLSISLNENKCILKFHDIEIELSQGIMIHEEKDTVLLNRIIVLNEILVRFFLKLIMGIYDAYREEW